MSSNPATGSQQTTGSDSAALLGRTARRDGKGAKAAEAGAFDAAVDAAKSSVREKHTKPAATAQTGKHEPADDIAAKAAGISPKTKRALAQKLDDAALEPKLKGKTAQQSPQNKDGASTEPVVGKPRADVTARVETGLLETAEPVRVPEPDTATGRSEPDQPAAARHHAPPQVSDATAQAKQSASGQLWAAMALSRTTGRSDAPGATPAAKDDGNVEPRRASRPPAVSDLPPRSSDKLAAPHAMRMPDAAAQSAGPQLPGSNGAARALDMFGFARNGAPAAAIEARMAGPGAERADALTLSNTTVTIVEARQFPGLSPTQSSAAAVVGAVSGNEGWSALLRGAESVSAASLNQTQNTVNTLKIRLSPAELGTVDATLKLSGNQLVVELKVETAEAYRQISDGQQQILKALKAQGFAVEQMSIQQAGPERGVVQSAQSTGQGSQGQGDASTQSGQGNSSQPGGGDRSGREGKQEGTHDHQPHKPHDVPGSDDVSGAPDAVYL